MTVNYGTYMKDKIGFLNKHTVDVVDTTPMDEYGRYCKQYICEDGAIFTEEMYPCYEEVEAEVEVRGIKVTLKDTVKLMRTEYYSTDDATSRYYYERW